jgi:hypothetical protein
VSGQIWTPWKVLIAQRDQNSTEMAPPVEEVPNIISSNSSKWIFIIDPSSHITPDRNCFKSFSSARGTRVFADMDQVVYRGDNSVLLSCQLSHSNISDDLLHCILDVLIFRKYTYM